MPDPSPEGTTQAATGNDDIGFRTARREDLPEMVALLADDPLGSQREGWAQPRSAAYEQAFAAIEAQAGNDLIVAEIAGQIVGCLQLTMIPCLSRQGKTRAQLEGIRVATPWRGRRVGERLIRHALDRARKNGCELAQLTTDVQRTEAARFYERLGFRPTHIGMKLDLD